MKSLAFTWTYVYEHDLKKFFLFCVEKFLREENIQLRSRRFFSFPKTVHDEQTSHIAYCKAEQLVSYINEGCGRHRGEEARSGGFRIPLPAIIFTLLHFLRNTLTHSYKIITKKEFFGHNLGFYDKWDFFFSKTICFPNKKKQIVISERFANK